MTSKPFAVNITLLPAIVPPDYHGYAQAIIDEGIKIVETAGNSPGPVIKQLKEAGCIVLHKCTTIRHAQSAIKLGVDFLSIDGFECAGHVGESDITNFILLSRARQSLGVPFIASGGFADGQGLAAALALGAEGINMGTRFMCTVEAPIHQNVKDEIVKASETDTQLVMRRWKNTSRLYGNKIAKEAAKIEKESKEGKFEEVQPLVSGKRGREVFVKGDVDYGVWTAGQVIGLIHGNPSAKLVDGTLTLSQTSQLATTWFIGSRRKRKSPCERPILFLKQRASYDNLPQRRICLPGMLYEPLTRWTPNVRPGLSFKDSTYLRNEATEVRMVSRATLSTPLIASITLRLCFLLPGVVDVRT